MLKLAHDADALFIVGGDQAQYQGVWGQSKFSAILQNKLDAGDLTVGGTSAGMAVLSGTVFLGGYNSTDALKSPNAMASNFQPSFLNIPVFDDMVFETHFWQRDRMGRAAAMVAVSGASQLIAADAGAGLTIGEDGIATVVAAAPSTMQFGAVDANGNPISGGDAEHDVYFMTSVGATNQTGAAVDAPLNITGIPTCKLGAGQQFDINAWRPIGAFLNNYYVNAYYDVSEEKGVVFGSSSDIGIPHDNSPYGGFSPVFDADLAFKQASAINAITNVSSDNPLFERSDDEISSGNILLNNTELDDYV